MLAISRPILSRARSSAAPDAQPGPLVRLGAQHVHQIAVTLCTKVVKPRDLDMVQQQRAELSVLGLR